eukprot:128906-Chlamydomonas_euryale.AAC.1
MLHAATSMTRPRSADIPTHTHADCRSEHHTPSHCRRTGPAAHPWHPTTADARTQDQHVPRTC